MKIETRLERKGHDVVTVKAEASLFEVVEKLRNHRIGCVVVSRDGKRVDGLVAVRDIAYLMAERADRIRAARGSPLRDRQHRRRGEIRGRGNGPGEEGPAGCGADASDAGRFALARRRFAGLALGVPLKNQRVS